mgnify:FL=1
MKEKIVQTAGRDRLNAFAKEFAHYNDDVLFGENWNNEDISLKTRCIVTLTALISMGITDSSLKFHLLNAKKNGVTKKEIAAIITHIAFYSGWPKAWASFNLAKEIWCEENENDDLSSYADSIMFPVGDENVGFNKYFTGKSYLAPISLDQVKVFNVTFEPGCRNFWHIHNASNGGGQILICVGGLGYYQEEGKEAVKLQPGDVINIKAGVKHWHGARKESYFSHLAIEVPGENTSTTWCEEVSDEEYSKLED